MGGDQRDRPGAGDGSRERGEKQNRRRLLGSAQIKLSDGGWPLTLSAFDPYGQELETQTSTDHYKSSGKERDSESGFDHLTIRA